MDPTSLQHYMRTYPTQLLQPTKAGDPAVDFLVFGRLAFAFLDKARPNNRHPHDRSKDSFSANVILPVGTDLAPIQTAFVNRAVAHFGPQWASLGKPLKNGFLRDQAKTAAKYKGFSTDPTAKHIEGSSKFAIPVFDANKLPMTCEKGKGVYSGMWVLAHFHLYAYPKPGPDGRFVLDNPGISARLVELQKVCDDEEFKSEGQAGAAFGVVAHAGGAAPAANGHAPTANAPQSIPGF